MLNLSTVPMSKKSRTVTFISLDEAIRKAWTKIAPTWPLKNIIACNPLQGFEDLPIEDALAEGLRYFESEKIPGPVQEINKICMKWNQAYFDQGQATLAMPGKKSGFYHAWSQLIIHDQELFKNQTDGIEWFRNLPESPKAVIEQCLKKLMIPVKNYSEFLTLLLTSLPGWAAYIKQQTEWESAPAHEKYNLEIDYLAMRLVVTVVLWPAAKEWLEQQEDQAHYYKQAAKRFALIQRAELKYRGDLVSSISAQASGLTNNQTTVAKAQLVFCIDVRSEPFRRALESLNQYETYGFAGFFGLPIQISNEFTNADHPSCPVLLKPQYQVNECLNRDCQDHLNLEKSRENLRLFKKLYQTIKYTFTTPLALVEALGPLSGLSMLLKTIMPTRFEKLKQSLLRNAKAQSDSIINLKDLSIDTQTELAASALKAMGLIRQFSPLVVFCGHGSSTQNNAYASALDCGACGGHEGSPNARILAAILNQAEVRLRMKDVHGIDIPTDTLFIGALHDTTTDEVSLFTSVNRSEIDVLKNDLKLARELNSAIRATQMGIDSVTHPVEATKNRSLDWAMTRPEWGLAKNAAFIVAPRALTRELNLQGRTFLHSYDYEIDSEGAILTTILTAPMVVAQWINSQYLFSTLNPVAYGGGNKITQNITGKIGVIQGNSSDLMHGLPLQSLYLTDSTAYHEPQRLLTIVYAPLNRVSKVIESQPVLQKLFGNGWVSLVCIDPSDRRVSALQRDLTWFPYFLQ